MTILLTAALLTIPTLDDRPPLEDLALFPPLCISTHERSQALAYREHLHRRAEFYSSDPGICREVLDDAAWRFDCWDWLDWAHNMKAEQRRLALKMLRQLLGPEAYHAGLMPAPFPN